MVKNYRKASIPNLKKKTSYIGPLYLNYLSLTLCIIIGIVMAVLIASAYTFAAYPNSNFPPNL